MTADNNISVTAVDSRREMKEFIRYPLDLYRGDPCFVPHLLSERKDFFSARNPLFQFTDVAYFLARDEHGNILGRATAHINHRHNEFAKEKTGFFGFFECVERPDVARALLQTAEDWQRERGMTIIRGPFNFSTNEECGFLVEGFDKLPALMMPYTKRYYLEFMEQSGYRRAKDLLAYDLDSHGEVPEYLVRFSRRVRERTDVTVRMMDMSRFEEEVATIFNIYNSAWAENWGFIPMTEEEFHYLAKGLRPVVEPAMALIAEKDGKPIGFSLSLPDYNPLLKKTGGRLFPFGFLHFLFGKGSIHRARVITLGVIEEYRNRGIDILLYHDTFRNAIEIGYPACEISWVLEDNVLMQRAAERMGGVLYKRYRIFEKTL